MYKIRKGLDLPIAGAPKPVIGQAPASRRVAVLGRDFHGLKPRLAVQVGDKVRRGQLLFEDRKNPGVRHTAPGTGEVVAVHRGARRAFQSLVIELAEGDAEHAQVELASHAAAASGGADEVRALLLDSGAWTAFRTRPFSNVPAVDATPDAIFITAIDTAPLAPDPTVVLAGEEATFHAGVDAVAKLCGGKTYLCVAPGSSLAKGAAGVEIAEFAGPHPAGTAGLHIHTLAPVDRNRTVWHIGYQDVHAIGALLETGKLHVGRVSSLAGPGVRAPRLLRTRSGAAIDPIVDGNLVEGEHRVISGSVILGHQATGEVHGYLGRYDCQISVISEDRRRRLLGWCAPGTDSFSIMPVFLSKLMPKKFRFTTTTNGSARAMVPIGMYESVMPMDLMATHLLRALAVGDVEWAEELGCLELDEEDLALCTFVCPGKTDHGATLRAVLDQIQKDG